MSTSAIVMMVVSLVVVWGGLLAAVIHLRMRPRVGDDELTTFGPAPDEDLDREQQAPLHRDT